jgi:hypothetical protein
LGAIQFFSILFAIQFLQNTVLVTFWAIFFQTHLVALLAGHNLFRESVSGFGSRTRLRFVTMAAKPNGPIRSFIASKWVYLIRREMGRQAGLPDFSCQNIPKRGKIYQIAIKLLKCP